MSVERWTRFANSSTRGDRGTVSVLAARPSTSATERTAYACSAMSLPLAISSAAAASVGRSGQAVPASTREAMDRPRRRIKQLGAGAHQAVDRERPAVRVAGGQVAEQVPLVDGQQRGRLEVVGEHDLVQLARPDAPGRGPDRRAEPADRERGVRVADPARRANRRRGCRLAVEIVLGSADRRSHRGDEALAVERPDDHLRHDGDGHVGVVEPEGDQGDGAGARAAHRVLDVERGRHVGEPRLDACGRIGSGHRQPRVRAPADQAGAASHEADPARRRGKRAQQLRDARQTPGHRARRQTRARRQGHERQG